MKKIRIGRLVVQLLWMSLIITSLVNERMSYFRTPILLGTLLLGPIYCGWLCVFGTFQDIMSKLGSKILKKRYKLPKSLHNYLKGFRYVLLVMVFISFLQAFHNYDGRISFLRVIPKVKILETKNNQEVIEKSEKNVGLHNNEGKGNGNNKSNNDSRNNQTTIFFFGIVAFYGVLAFFVDRPFCNYLCTEGARYGILSKLRLFSIKRDKSVCVDCKKCDKVCPMNIEVSKEEVVQDAHCISCFNCIASCPKKGAIKIGKVF